MSEIGRVDECRLTESRPWIAVRLATCFIAEQKAKIISSFFEVRATDEMIMKWTGRSMLGRKENLQTKNVRVQRGRDVKRLSIEKKESPN